MSDAVYNVQKDLDAGFDEVWSVALDEAVRLQTERQLHALGLDDDKRVRLVSADELAGD